MISQDFYGTSFLYLSNLSVGWLTISPFSMNVLCESNTYIESYPQIKMQLLTISWAPVPIY